MVAQQLFYSLSLSFPVGGGGTNHRPNPLQELPQASWIRVEYSSQPDVSSGLVMSWTPELYSRSSILVRRHPG